MNDGGAVPSEGRPLCACHGLPADRDGHGRYHCAEKRRARQLARYHADPQRANWKRTRFALKARIRRKRRQLDELEHP